MKKHQIIILLLALTFIFTSCKECEPIIYRQYIRDTIIKITPPVIIDSGRVQIVTDTLVEYIRIKGNDTIIQVKYFPKVETIKILAKPDTINLFKRDTLLVTEVKEIVQEKNSFLTYLFGILLAFSLLYLLAKYFNKD